MMRITQLCGERYCLWHSRGGIYFALCAYPAAREVAVTPFWLILGMARVSPCLVEACVPLHPSACHQRWLRRRREMEKFSMSM